MTGGTINFSFCDGHAKACHSAL
ncbi:MAG: hypothetical protein KAW89_10800 [Armatimonadetes bacterium]|nr:hypothetical protein [Armatimonadota bacterium]